jgi:hypothetical protein
MFIRTVDKALVRLGEEKNHLVLLNVRDSFVVDYGLVEL